MKLAILAALLIAADAQAGELEPIRGSLCVQASVDRLSRVANGFADWTQIPESTYKVGKFQLIRLVSTQTAPWDQAVAASSVLSALPEAERATRAGTDQLAFFFFQPGQLGKDSRALYPRFAARCTGQASDKAFHQDCRQVATLQHFGVDSFTSSIDAAESDTCAAGQLRLTYEVRMTLNDGEVKQTRDALLGGFSMLGGVLAPPETFIRGYFENFYPGWKAYAEKP